MVSASTHAFGYLRVSGLSQVRNGEGLAVQRSALEHWCALHRVPLALLESDEGLSGASMQRPGLRRLLRAALQAAEAGSKAVVLVYKLDRLGRNALDVQETLGALLDSGVRVVAVADAVDSASHIGGALLRLLTMLLSTFAELERETITSRMRAGREHARANGRLYASEPPYGLRLDAEARTLVPDELEQAAIARARALEAEGHSFRAIAKVLTDEGHRPRRASAWSKSIVGRLLVGRESRRAKVEGARHARVRADLLRGE